MRFLVDAQLPAALARWLAAHGHATEHVSDRKMQAASDNAISNCAVADSAVIVTKDEDFARRRAFAGAGPAIVWIRIGNTRTRELLNVFERLFPAILAALKRGEVLIEIT